VGGLEVANSVEDPGSSGFWRLRWEDEEERKQGSRAVRLCLEPSRVVLRTGFFCATIFSTALCRLFLADDRGHNKIRWSCSSTTLKHLSS
jgi:hypothetical protein